MSKTLKFFAAFALVFVLSASAFPAEAEGSSSSNQITSEPFSLCCNFYDSKGNQTDGNSLTAGEYKVDVVLSGVSAAAVIQFEAEVSLGGAGIGDLKVNSTLADSDSSFENAFSGYLKDGSLAVILSSKESTSSEIDEGGTVIATFSLNLTGNDKIDFSDYFNFISDPDLTFIQTDFESSDVIALSKSEEVSYTVTLMTADVSPEFSKDIIITGKVIISTDAAGTDGTFGARGVRFKVNGDYVSDSSGNVVTTSSESGHYGEFEISVPKGTTSIVVTSDSSVDRTVTLSGTEDISGAEIFLVIADYTKDGLLNATDLACFKSNIGSSDPLYDYNDDNVVNATDLSLFLESYGESVNYDNYILGEFE